jgi:methionyl-tRNA formyltransferase
VQLVFLTTQTTHHTHFVRQMQSHGDVAGCVLEVAGVEAPFEIGHEYLDKQHTHEVCEFFGGVEHQIVDLTPAVLVSSINDPAAIEAVRAWQPDMTIAFGVRQLSVSTINRIPGIVLNLHGGDSEEYRGLDTLLWAIYHADFGSLVATLHAVAPTLDTGDIVGRQRIPLRRGMLLHELRAATTDVCIELVRDAVYSLKSSGELNFTKQKKRGRYYSFMPSALKDHVKCQFEKYTSTLA